MTILLFLAYGLALTAAYRVASRLAPTSVIHTTALTIFLFLLNLIVPAIYVGVVGLLRPEGMFIGGLLLWGTEWVLAGRLQPLPAVEFAPDDRRLLLFRRAAYAICALLFTAVAGATWALYTSPVSDIDAAWHYFPAMINMVQAGTLHNFNSFLPYFPLAYEMIFAWEMAFTRTYLVVPGFHQIILAGSLLYCVLILHWLLRGRSALVRDLATVALLMLLTGMQLSTTMLEGSGKNDILLLLCTLAASFYFLRFWFDGQDGRFLVLAGLACGLQVSTKLTAGTWLAVFAVVQLGSWVRIRAAPQRIVRDLVSAGIPFAILLLPWAVRVLANPSSLSSQSDVNSLAAQFTIIRNWNHPGFNDPVLKHWHEIAFIAGGLILALSGQLRKRRLFWLMAGGFGLIFAGLTLQGHNRVFGHSFAALWTILLVSLCFLMYWTLNHSALKTEVVVISVLVVLTLGLFAFVPYSAWIYPLPYLVERTFYNVNYRYTPGTYYLFIISVIAVAAHWLTIEKRQIFLRPISFQQNKIITGGIVPAILILLTAHFLLNSMDGVVARYENFNAHYPEPTWFFDIYLRDLSEVTIYAINAPPLLLYGEEFNNTVYYVTDGYTGYYGDQAYRWAEIEQIIQDKEIDYIVLSFNFPEVAQAGLAPNPAVLAELQAMRSNLTLVHEDEHFIMFATSYAP